MSNLGKKQIIYIYILLINNTSGKVLFQIHQILGKKNICIYVGYVILLNYFPLINIKKIRT